MKNVKGQIWEHIASGLLAYVLSEVPEQSNFYRYIVIVKGYKKRSTLMHRYNVGDIRCHRMPSFADDSHAIWERII